MANNKLPKKPRKPDVAARIDALAERKRAFAREWLLDRNGRAAAIRAGYSYVSARVLACRLLTDPVVREEIEKHEADAQIRWSATIDELIGEASRIALADPRDLYDENGNIRPIHEWSDDVAGLVQSVKSVRKEFRTKDGEEYAEPEIVTEIKLYHKLEAMEKLFKHLGMYEKDNRQKADATMELLAHVQANSRPLPASE